LFEFFETYLAINNIVAPKIKKRTLSLDMSTYSESELILNPDGSVFHLRLFPEQISDYIILVGDPGRVPVIGRYLERVESLASNREFISLSGYYNGVPVTVLSTGIGTDNIDIVVNELDILANIDLKTREEKLEKRHLTLIRIGTSGAIQPDLPGGTAVASAWSVGLDGLMNYYDRGTDPVRDAFEQSMVDQLNWPVQLPRPYAAQASPALLERVASFCTIGITISAHGFYGPQGRELRGKLAVPDMNSRLQLFHHQQLAVTNYEMESAALYGLAHLLGHEALTVCTIIANRMTSSFSGNYVDYINELTDHVLATTIPNKNGRRQ